MRGPAGGAAPAHGRRREPQGDHQQPGAVLRAEAKEGHKDPRAAGGARGAAEVVRGTGAGDRGQRLAGLAHEIFLKLLKAKREVPSAAERQKTLVGQGGKCALGLTAGTCELDHVVPVSLESRVAPGVMEYARSPKLPSLVFKAQACQRDALYVGVDVVRCRRNGLANAPFPLPILCPADGVEPLERRDAGVPASNCAATRPSRAFAFLVSTSSGVQPVTVKAGRPARLVRLAEEGLPW